MGVEQEVPLAGRYRLLAVVGKGGMGTVWRARDETLNRDVAVKEVLLPVRLSRGERAAMCRRLVSEARATAALRHPGVATVYDVVEQDGRPWIVMELLKARSLHELIAYEGALSSERAAEIGCVVLSVLRAAHAEGILHRDVKPSNVLVCDDGRVVLTDFGLAVQMEHGEAIVETMVNGIEGSPAYLSPEQVRGGAGGAASDLWSLGAMLYAAVQGHSPFLRCHALASLVAVLLGEYEPPERAGAELRTLIEGLLRQDPADRLSAEQAALLLESAAGAEPMSKPAVHLARPARPRRPRVGALVSVATLAAVVIAVGAWSARWNSVGTSDALAILPAPGHAKGTVSYQEPDGYAVEVPSGWTRVVRDDGVQWDDRASGRRLRIAPVSGNALDGLRAAEHVAVARQTYPGYHRLRLEATPELAEGAAEWEFASAGLHGLSSRIAGYEFLFTTPEGRWTPGQRLYDAILKTFRPRD